MNGYVCTCTHTCTHIYIIFTLCVWLFVTLWTGGSSWDSPGKNTGVPSPPGDLTDPEIKHGFPMSRVLQVYFYQWAIGKAISTYTQTHTHIHIHTHTHIYTHTHTHIYTHRHRHTHTQTHTYTYTHRHTHIHMHIHTYTHTHQIEFTFAVLCSV